MSWYISFFALLKGFAFRDTRKSEWEGKGNLFKGGKLNKERSSGSSQEVWQTCRRWQDQLRSSSEETPMVKKLRRGDGKKRSRKLLRQMTHQMENSTARSRGQASKPPKTGKEEQCWHSFRPLFILLPFFIRSQEHDCFSLLILPLEISSSLPVWNILSFHTWLARWLLACF